MSRRAYRSGLEKQTAAQLNAAGVKFKYENRKLNYYKVVRGGTCPACGATRVLKRGSYLVDFDIAPVLIETKGRLTSSDRTKYIAVKEEHDDLDLRFVFGRDNKLSRQSATRYSAWAAEHGFKWAIGRIPDEWIAEFAHGQRSSRAA